MASKKFFKAGRRLYVPSAPSSRRYYRWGWEVALTGWTNLYWFMGANLKSRFQSAQRSALVKTVRKILKKKGNVQFNVHHNHILTGRPVGIQMGKGKGKGKDHCGWVRQGTSLATFFCTLRGVAQRTKIMCKRTNVKPRLYKLFY